jgi:methylphosphonate synthase
MNRENLKKIVGHRILSEANDLKRTVKSLAAEIEIDEKHLQKVIQGECSMDETHRVIRKMGNCYPIDISDLYFDEDDCDHNVKIMRSADSASSSRIFDRKDASGDRTPYYDYRDTAMSKLGPFKPEWIKELRTVNDADPENPDIAYNNGHFLHQATFFIGPVNFYWEVKGKKYCQEMNTGDSNYITPFWPHSFASRDPNHTALIIAVTFGGDVRRAQKEIYRFGSDRINQFQLDNKNPNRAATQLLKQHMANENLTKEAVADNARDLEIDIDITALLDESKEKSFDDLNKIAKCLNIDVVNLMLPQYEADQEVVVTQWEESKGFYFPSLENKNYKIWPLAKSASMPLMKGSNIHVLSQEADLKNAFNSSMHSYIYNYGSVALLFRWSVDEKILEDILHPGDSVYVQPFVKHAFGKQGEEPGHLFMARVSGSVNVSTQKEMSCFADTERIIESKCWFD